MSITQASLTSHETHAKIIWKYLENIYKKKIQIFGYFLGYCGDTSVWARLGTNRAKFAAEG